MNLPPRLVGMAPRTLISILSGALLLMLAAAWPTLLRDEVNTFRGLVAQRDESAVNVKREREVLRASQSVDAARVAVVQLEKELYGGGPQVPVSQMASHVIGRLDALAAQFQVRLDSVKPGAQSELLGFTEVPFDVQVHGDYLRLIGWLEAIEDALHPMVLKRFHLARPASSAVDGDNDLRMELRVVSYRAPRV